MHATPTPRLHLRRLRRADAPMLCAAYARSRGDLDAGIEPADTLERAREAIARYAGEHARGDRYVYGAFERESGAFVGCGALTPTDARAANVGLWVDAGARGRGAGTEIAAALTALAFERHGADRVEIWCELANHHMAQIAARLGFVHEATLRSWGLAASGERRDQMLWRLDPSAFEPRRGVASADDLDPGADAMDVVWTRLADHLHARHEVVGEAARSCVLAVEVAFRSKQRFIQHVVVEQGGLGGAPWWMIRALVGPETLLEQAEALRHNATLAVGSLALERGQHVLRHGTPTDATSLGGVDRIIAMLAHEATRLREAGRTAPEAHARAFAGYVD